MSKFFTLLSWRRVSDRTPDRREKSRQNLVSSPSAVTFGQLHVALRSLSSVRLSPQQHRTMAAPRAPWPQHVQTNAGNVRAQHLRAKGDPLDASFQGMNGIARVLSLVNSAAFPADCALDWAAKRAAFQVEATQLLGQVANGAITDNQAFTACWQAVFTHVADSAAV